ncbi:MAG TPA: hypothetical protein VM096_06145 [Vicinamibacterales bacterium]|nr:hypothetical protein [Vicinamibacterales bacterium]
MRIASGVVIAVLAASGLRAQDSQGDAQYRAEMSKERDTAIRAFHNSPSLERFSEAGTAIMTASGWLNATDRKESDLPPKHPEFEKMKARLAAGIVVPASALPAPPAFSDRTDRVTLAMLPAIRPSFFPASEPVFAIALRPFKLVDEDVDTLIDALSAVNRVTMRIRTAGPIRWGSDGPLGAWDVDSVEARFDQDSMVHGLTRDGQSTGYRVRSVKAPIGSRYCSDRGGSVVGTRVTAAWDSSIVAWIGKPAPGKATITSRQTGRDLEKLVTENVDLDQDNVPDFSIWAGAYAGIGELPVQWKAVFVNVGGKWLLGSYRSAPDCT